MKIFMIHCRVPGGPNDNPNTVPVSSTAEEMGKKLAGKKRSSFSLPSFFRLWKIGIGSPVTSRDLMLSRQQLLTQDVFCESRLFLEDLRGAESRHLEVSARLVSERTET